MAALAGCKVEGVSPYMDFQSRPLHIKICSSSKDNRTQGTNCCQIRRKVRKQRDLPQFRTTKLHLAPSYLLAQFRTNTNCLQRCYLNNKYRNSP